MRIDHSQFKSRYFVLAALMVMLSCSVHAMDTRSSGTPPLVPMPKTYRPQGNMINVAGMPLFITADNRQCAIAAEELGKRITALGGKAGVTETATDTSKDGMYILTVDCDAAKHIIAEYALHVSAFDPGPQGYIIRTRGNRIMVIGSDSVGALYGAMTLRQMIVRAGGMAAVMAADVEDRPDYRYRVGVEFRRSIKRYMLTQEKDPVTIMKTVFDWMLHFKINMIGNYIGIDPREASEKDLTFYQTINQYAVDRGIYPTEWGSTIVAFGTFDKGREFKDWPGYHYRKGGGEKYYCWSRDDLAEKRAKEWAAYMRRCHFKILFLHPIDRGGIDDPEFWSKRCPACRKRWKDDERWKASVHQFNLWLRIFRKYAPEVIICSPVYPYNAEYAKRERFPTTSEELWRRNSIDYWQRVHAGITDSRFVPMSWTAQRRMMDQYRACWNGRPICIFAHSFVSCGYFGTWHRNTKTNYYGHPHDIFLLAAGGCNAHSEWLNYLCSNEFAWNTLAPGHETYTGLYYDAEKDHTGPPVIMEKWVPRACRAFFGEAVGKLIAPVYNAGVQPLYIMDPGRGIALANKMRRRPLADVAPEMDPAKANLAAPVAEDIKDSTDRMAAQVEATRKALKALELAYTYKDTLDYCKQKVFLYYYRRMYLWHLVADARYACYQAIDFQRQGKHDAAAKVLKDALNTYERDFTRFQAMLSKTKNAPDLAKLPIVHPNNRDRLEHPGPERIKHLLQELLTSVSIILKPRRPGETIRVGIYRGIGQEGTKTFFDGFRNVKAEIIDSLSLAVLDKFDCVFILQTKSVNRDEFFQNLPRYVREGGGGVFLQHDMCGRPKRGVFGAKTPFPAICKSAHDRKETTSVIIKKSHPALGNAQPDKIFKHMYNDHLTLIPGPNGVTIVTDKEGDPVVITGTLGYGKVIFDGNVNLTSSNQDKPLTGFNACLAKGAVEWFTGIRLEPK